MSEEADMEAIDGLFDKIQACCVGCASADVMYVIGRLIAKAVIDNPSTVDLDTTLFLLGETAKLEIASAMAV